MRLELSQTADIESAVNFVDTIRVMAEKHQAKVVIIDNITWLCNRCEEGDSAGQLMQALVELKPLSHCPTCPT